MTSKTDTTRHNSIGAWAKRCYFAGRNAVEAALRPYELGATQWYVLHHLANNGPTMQRDLLRMLEVERATLSVIVGTLVRKGLVEQVPDRVDQRQKSLRMTEAGTTLWGKLPDLAVVHEVAFDGIDAAAIATAIRVLQTATAQLEQYSWKGPDE